MIDDESVMHLWSELKRHHRRQRKAKIPVKELEGFTLNMMGSSSHLAMKTQGVETTDLLPFVVEQLKAHHAALPHPQARHLIPAGEALLDFFDESPIRISNTRNLAAFPTIRRTTNFSTWFIRSTLKATRISSPHFSTRV